MSASRIIIPPSNSNGSSPKKPASQKKIEANRRNARRSTGPKTVNGKKAVSRNALKHGLLAREVVIASGDGAENAEEFQVLLERLWAHYQPDGIVEEMLVEKTATCWWRFARVLRAETGEIRKKLDSARLEYHVTATNGFNLGLFSADLYGEGMLYNATNETDRKVSSEERRVSIQKFQSDLRRNELGAAYLRHILSNAKSEIEGKGGLSEQTRCSLLDTSGVCDYAFVRAIINACADEVQDRETALEEGCKTQVSESQSIALLLIDHSLKVLEWAKLQAAKKEDLGEEAELRSLCIPSSETTDKLLRYETHLERQLQRAMDQLERLQRRRAGESVPPPLNVNLARRM